jgi:hypothetical protein
LASTVFVEVGQSIIVAGKWFSPGNVTLRWDGVAHLSEAVADGTGLFSATITVPSTSAGTHDIVINSGNVEFSVAVARLPVTSNDYDETWHTSDFRINLTPDFQVSETFYRINGGPISNVSAGGQPLIATESSNNVLEYWSIWDVGGISMELQHVSLSGIKLDKTAPTGNILISNGSEYCTLDSVILNLTAFDALSGVYQVRLSNDGVWDTEQWQPSSPIVVWVLSLGDGAKTVYYQIKDNAGSVASFNDSITLDTSSPVVNAGQNQTVNAGSLVNFDASGSTDNIGVSSYLWDFGDGNMGTGATANHTYTGLGTYTARLTVQDVAGNAASGIVTVTVQASAIPEFPSVFALLLIMAATLLVAIGKKAFCSVRGRAACSI